MTETRVSCRICRKRESATIRTAGDAMFPLCPECMAKADRDLELARREHPERWGDPLPQKEVRR